MTTAALLCAFAAVLGCGGTAEPSSDRTSSPANDKADVAPVAQQPDSQSSKTDSPPAPWLGCRLDEGGAPSASALAESVLSILEDGADIAALQRLGASPCHYLWFLWRERSVSAADRRVAIHSERLRDRYALSKGVMYAPFVAALADLPNEHTLTVAPCTLSSNAGTDCRQLELRFPPGADSRRLAILATEVSGRWLLLAPPTAIQPANELIAQLEETLAAGLPIIHLPPSRAALAEGTFNARGMGHPAGLSPSWMLAESIFVSLAAPGLESHAAEARRLLEAAIDAQKVPAQSAYILRASALDPLNYEASVAAAPPVDESVVAPEADAVSFEVMLLAYDKRRARHEPTDQLDLAVDDAGIVVTAVEPRSLLRVLGVRPGDTILSVGDEPTTPANVARQLPPVVDAPSRIEVKLSRAGTPRTLVWSFK